MAVLNVLGSTRSVTWPVKVMIIACISSYIYKKCMHVILYIKWICKKFYFLFLFFLDTVNGCEIFFLVLAQTTIFSY